jgi:hypothetical protein
MAAYLGATRKASVEVPFEQPSYVGIDCVEGVGAEELLQLIMAVGHVPTNLSASGPPAAERASRSSRRRRAVSEWITSPPR